MALLGGRPAGAQPGPCEDVLAEAEARYLEQDYSSVEPYVVECVYRPGVTEQQLQAAYRLLALAYIKQDLFADAQLTIVKLFGVDYEYEPDPVQDPPTYVALVSAVKDQLRVDESRTPPPPETPPSTPNPPEAATYEPASAMPPPEVRRTQPSPRQEPPTGVPSAPAGGRVDINTASAAELESLAGIGPALARRILDYRTDYGPFARPEDLQNVRGIGPRTIESLLPQITAGGGTAALPVMATPADAGTASGPRINLNTASAQELDALHGIGPALAQRIVESREREGRFRSVDEVTRVPGIGPAKLDGFRDQVTVDG